MSFEAANLALSSSRPIKWEEPVAPLATGCSSGPADSSEPISVSHFKFILPLAFFKCFAFCLFIPGSCKFNTSKLEVFKHTCRNQFAESRKGTGLDFSKFCCFPFCFCTSVDYCFILLSKLSCETCHVRLIPNPETVITTSTFYMVHCGSLSFYVLHFADILFLMVQFVCRMAINRRGYQESFLSTSRRISY